MIRVSEPEMTMRRVRLKLANSNSEQCYLTGYYAGIDYARKQAVVIFVIAVAAMKLIGWM